MPLDIVSQIAQAEAEQKLRLAQAERDARAQVAQARRDGEELISRARQGAEAQVEALLTQADARAAEAYRHALDAAEEDCAALSGAAQPRMDRAVALIVSRVQAGGEERT